MKRVATFIILMLTMSACKIAVDVSTVVHAGGDGLFHVVFSFDKEFVTVVSSTADGRRSLQALRSIGSEKTTSGWSLRSVSANGGLTIVIDRSFSRPGELNSALSEVGSRPQTGSLAFLNIFRDFHLTQSSSYSRTLTDVRGTVDLAPERLAPGFSNANPSLRQALQQAASNVFSFRVSVSLPGHVTHYSGSPTRFDGGKIEWSAPFGSTLVFSGHASYVRWVNLGYAAAPFVALVLVGSVLLVRRARKRAAPVEGWEVPAAVLKEEST